MRIILVRHGLTEANISRTFSSDDTLLHEDGYFVLEKTKKALENYNIDRVYTSALIRSQQTAKLLGFEDFTIDSRINEQDVGDFKGLLYDDVWEKHRELFEGKEGGLFNISYPGGESIADLRARTSEFLDELVKRDEDALCISHGQAIKSCLFWILEDLSAWESFWIENGSITVFKIEDGKKLIESVNRL